MNKMKRSGPSDELCGTPVCTDRRSEVACPMDTSAFVP